MLYRRDQTPDPGLGVKETLVRIATVQADIQPTYPGTFYNSVAVDTPVSHMITCRWQDYIENTHVIMRSTLRPPEQVPAYWDRGQSLWDASQSIWDRVQPSMGDTGWDPSPETVWDDAPVTEWDEGQQRQRTELYRVRRIRELAGRKRFVAFECELERAHTTYDDRDATRQGEFMEPTITGEPLV